MKVLVSTRQTQGMRKNDFSWTTEGELLKLPMFECDGELLDGACGCKRSLAGMESSKATTTAVVSDRDLTPVQLAEHLYDTLYREGWLTLFEAPSPEAMQVVQRTMKDTLALYILASQFEVGTIIERRGHRLKPRTPVH